MFERRTSKRFKVDWDVRVCGADAAGTTFEEAGFLDNLSSNGALVSLRKGIDIGTRLDVLIQVPLKKKNFMKYSAEIVRLEQTGEKYLLGVKFSTIRPVFVDQ